jgi:uncharacterized membrane protein YdjX (TVP38/TMEM64 family)
MLLTSTLVVGLVVVLVWRLPVARLAIEIADWIRHAGWTGVLVFAVVYIVATVALLPASILTVGAGFAYGPLLGTLVVSPVSTVAATVAFLLGRTAQRNWIAGRVARLDRFGAVYEAVGHEGFRIVLLLRLSPLIPFALLNYALGLTHVRVRDFVLASWIGMLPATVLYVYLGSLLTSASQISLNVSAEHRAARLLYWGGLAATLAVVWIVSRIARRALLSALPPDRVHPFGPPAHPVREADHR